MTMLVEVPALARRERVWVRGPEGGILTQAFVACVCDILPPGLLRRWTFLRWQGTSVEAITEHFLAEPGEVRAALHAAHGMLDAQRSRMLAVLIGEEREILECMWNAAHDRAPVGVMPATWKFNGDQRTPALPKVREDTPIGAASERLEHLLRMLVE